MAIILPQDHLFLSHFDEINNLCKANLKPLGIKYFSFGRMFDDSSGYIINNNNCLNYYLFESESPPHTPVPHQLIKKKFSYLIPSYSGPYQKVMHEVKQRFNLSNAIDFFECHDGYIDIFCVGSDLESEQAINSYLSNQDFLGKFFLYFKEKASKFLNDLDKNSIKLPQHMQLNFKSSFIDKNHIIKQELLKKIIPTKVYLSGKYKHVHLTKREVDCLTALTMAFSAKEIGKLLKISPRTVEDYLNKIKLKLGCYTKSQLVSTALQHGLKDVIFNNEKML